MRFSMRLAALIGGCLLAACGGGGGGGSGDGGVGGTPANAPDLVMSAFSAPAEVVAGATYTVTGTVTNQGDAPAGGASAVIYLSPFSDVQRDGGHIGLQIYGAMLNPGQSWNFSAEVDIPDNMANGSYYLGAVASGDGGGANNGRSSPVTISGGTTCSPDAYEADNGTSESKTLVFGVAQQHNHCEATSDWFQFAAQEGQTYNIETHEVGGWLDLSLYDTDGQTVIDSGSQDPQEFGAERVSWTAPADGTYYLRVAPVLGVHSSGGGTEYRVTLGDERPDLYVSSLTTPSSGLPGGTIGVSDTVRNLGFSEATAFTVALYLSSDATVTVDDTLLGNRAIDAIGAGKAHGAHATYGLPNVTPGEYYLAAIVNPDGVVDEYATGNNTTSARPITITAPPDCTPDAYEQNDDSASPTAIAVGADAQAHNHCEDGVDWLSFTASAGSSYAIRIVKVGGYADPGAEVYAADGTTRLAGDWFDRTTSLDWQAPSSGTYLLKVQGFSGAARDYTVKIDPLLPDLTQTLSIYLSDNSVIAGGFLDLTDAVTNEGHIAAGPFEVGVFLSADDVVTTGDTLLWTRALDGLVANSYLKTDTAYGNPVHFPKATTLGAYSLGALADHGGAVVEMSEANNASAPLAIHVVAPACDYDAYEDDDTPATAKAMTVGEVQVRNHCDDGIDWVKFVPTADGTYVATGTSGLDVYEADATTLVTPHDTYFYDKLSWVATAGTTYYIKMFLERPAYTSGAYDLTLFQCSPDAYEDDDTYTAARPITSGQTRSHNHCEDRNDWVSFTATAGQTYTFTTSTNSARLSLYDTDGTSLLKFGSSQGKKEVLTWTAPANGTYFVKANRFEFGQNTDYTLTMN